MRALLAASIIVVLLVPQPSQAFSLRPVGHGLKVAAKKVGHVAEESLLITGMIIGAIAFCSTGACN